MIRAVVCAGCGAVNPRGTLVVPERWLELGGVGGRRWREPQCRRLTRRADVGASLRIAV